MLVEWIDNIEISDTAQAKHLPNIENAPCVNQRYNVIKPRKKKKKSITEQFIMYYRRKLLLALIESFGGSLPQTDYAFIE